MRKVKTLFLLRGLPGNGKTTAAETLAADLDFIHGPMMKYPVHCADDYFYENGPRPGEYDFDPSKLGHAHGQCKYRTELEMQKEETKIFVANTFTTEKEMEPYFELAEKYGYRVTSFIVENRHGNNSVHSVPEDKMQAMENRFTIKLR